MNMKLLRAERMNRGWTLENVQAITGIDKGAISRIERGVESCWPSWQEKLSKLYGLLPEELLREANFELVEIQEDRKG